MGKKKSKPMTESPPKAPPRPIRIDVAQDVYEAVDRVAAREGMNRTTYIRRLILADLRQRGEIK
jgi:predicted DNA binding CopG/RHH family protein